MIYCVEDDKSIRELMVYTLNASGFDVKGMATGKELFASLPAGDAQLVILDIMLPDEDGISILKKLRKSSSYSDIPVIMATAKGTEYDKVTGLDAGADDYLAKPFGMMEMVSRIKAVLRRCGPGKRPEVLKLSGLVIDPDEHTVSADGELIQLTFKEYELLKTFMESTGKAYSREELLHTVWGTDFTGETRTVDVHIGTLRTKLGKYGDLIKTVRGVGYRMEKSV
ncbi:MAG: response regulator transcription factor [Ruminiclostridium sp.]|nr:response regulator transcription factor [Ruminiclostridium sp.]